ncbi:DUF1007 family protein [Marinomonas sp. M1K-6]|uniref:DUF1007 family protein n=1 Tax=Marinomonas profundi TaxID=2726122 RepID=A0A847R692_9GAMM|nr:DUF1007 family protein [Marinomonas profundi]UDV04861.1 DUF1007 family protein [Marinomonas profundi]
MRYLSVFFSALFAVSAMAHPHVWVDSQYRVNVDQATIETLEATWGLDLFTSTSLIVEYDVDGDGELTGQEKLDMIEVLKSFDQYGFFIKMKQDGADIVPNEVQVLDVRVRDQMLWIRLGIALPTPVNLETSTLSFAFGDDELYFAMEPLEEGLVRLSGTLSETCTPIEREAEETSVALWVDLTCKP